MAFQIERKQTNADRIRRMTDEELAGFIADQRFCIVKPIAKKLDCDIEDSYDACRAVMLEWMKAEESLSKIISGSND